MLLGLLLLLLLFWFWMNVVIICISCVCAFIIFCISGVMLLGLGFARRGGICGLFKKISMRYPYMFYAQYTTSNSHNMQHKNKTQQSDDKFMKYNTHVAS